MIRLLSYDDVLVKSVKKMEKNEGVLVELFSNAFMAENGVGCFISFQEGAMKI